MKIAFLGDSVTASANVNLADRWAYKVGIYNGYAPENIINAGVPGNTSAQILARVQTDVINQGASVCVLMMTVNDKSNNIPIATHEANYRQMISQLQAAGIKVIIASPPVYRQAIDTWKAWVEKDQFIAGDLNLDYVDIWREYSAIYLYSASTFGALYVNSADLVHQSVAGNSKIAEVMTRSNYDGVFLPSQPQTGTCDELTLALADLQLNGATATRLNRVLSAI